MNYKSLSEMLVFLVVLLGVSTLSIAAENAAVNQVVEPTTTQSDKPMMDPEMMAKWQAYSTPNENHALLAKWVGSWTYVSKMWMAPGAPAEESTGTSEFTSILGGRFVEQTVSGTSMGQQFSGRGIHGYDNAEKQFVGVWFDDMGTGVMKVSGQYDAATQTLSEQGNMVCPFRGPMTMRWVTKLVDDNTILFQTFMPDDKGAEYMNMEITYKRK